MPDKTRDREITTLIARSLSLSLFTYLTLFLPCYLFLFLAHSSRPRRAIEDPLLFLPFSATGGTTTVEREGGGGESCPRPHGRDDGRKRMMARTLARSIDLRRRHADCHRAPHKIYTVLAKLRCIVQTKAA